MSGAVILTHSIRQFVSSGVLWTGLLGNGSWSDGCSAAFMACRYCGIMAGTTERRPNVSTRSGRKLNAGTRDWRIRTAARRRRRAGESCAERVR